MHTTLGKHFLEDLIKGAQIPRPTPMSPVTASDGSGLEIQSPHKLVSTQQQFPCTIEGIGELRTAWIGHKGVCILHRAIIVN